MKSAKKNYIYNLIYQIIALLTPLITTPYVARVLGASGIGQFAFTNSIASYFILFGSLGFSYYAQREIARNQDNKVEQTKVFYEIVIVRLLSVLLALLVHIVIAASGIYGSTYTLLMWILTINIASTAFDVSFLFQGNEEFGIIVLRNTIVRFIGIIAIFIFVKNETHVWLYTLCQSVVLIGSNVSLWTKVPKMLVKGKVGKLCLTRHIIPSLRLFVPAVAVSVYTVLDKTLIGVLISGTETIEGVEKNIADLESGFYDQAEKIVKIAMTIITSLGVVMIPRNSHAVATGDNKAFMLNVNRVLRFALLLGIPISFGLSAIAFNFSPWFFGKGYDKVPYLLILLSPLVFIIGVNNTLGVQYLIPLKKDSKFAVSIIIGALTNLCLNLLLIRPFLSYGAAFATIISETVVTIVMFVFARRDISFRLLLITSWKYFLCGIIMFAYVFLLQQILSPSISHTIFLIAEGALMYFLLLLIFKDTMMCEILEIVKTKIARIVFR